MNFFHDELLLLYFLHVGNTFTLFYNMDKERFTQFRSEFVQFIAFIKKGNDVDVVLTSFLREYPELTVEFVLPHLMKVPDIVMEEGLVKKDNRKPKNMEDITRRLIESVKDQKPWKDYTTMEINIANEEACF